MSESTQKKLVLNSYFNEVERLESYIDELQEWADFGKEDYDRIMLTLSEATTNAIVHGNLENPRKKVRIVTFLKKRTLTISVWDEGKGFDPKALPDPLREENLLNEGGRGVYLIEKYADKVTYSRNGTKITMTFELGDT